MKNGWLAAACVAVAAIALAVVRLNHGAGSGGVPMPVKITPGPAQPRVPPAEAGIDEIALQSAVAYAGERNTRALLVGRGGHIVFEKYWDDTTFDTAVEPGFPPVMLALATGVALDDRKIVGLDIPLSNYPGTPSDAAAETPRRLMAGEAAALHEDAADVLAGLLERLDGQPYQVIITERLWKPLGGGDLGFRAVNSGARSGAANAGCCLEARIGDWMRVGELLANDGAFEGTPLTPPGYVKQMLTASRRDATRGFYARVDGEFAAHDVAWLDGRDDQRLWIVPSLKLWILRLGAAPSAARGWDEAMIPDSIIRGTSGWQPRSAGEGVDPNKFAPH
jgi:hypothetical protein